METTACPCTSGKTYADCCQPYHEGKAKAPTAEALMRSRYSAFEKQQIDYLRDTLTAESQKTFDQKSTADWAATSTWKKLEIHETEKGQPGDTEGIVDFTAHFVMDGKDIAHRERARFSFNEKQGRWFYEEAIEAPKKPVVREATPGRNDPCTCGSGKKYKKCCAVAA